MNQEEKLIGKKIMLKKLSADDLDELQRIANNLKIAKQIVNLPHPYTAINASIRLGYVSQGWKDGSRYCFAIFDQSNDQLIGEISLHRREVDEPTAELGYWLGEQYWSKGYTSEAVGLIVEFGFKILKLTHIYATCNPDNIASQRVLTKHSFSKMKQKGKHLVYFRSNVQER